MPLFQRRKKEEPQGIVVVHDSDRERTDRLPGQLKYGKSPYASGLGGNVESRENGRGVFRDSLIARGLIARFVDMVINSGLTWEASPLWEAIPESKTWSDEQKRDWIETIETKWRLYASSKESDILGRSTFYQIQRLAYQLMEVEGECFVICRYLNSPERMNPLSLQVLNNDQIQNPENITTLERVKSRGGKIVDGIERDSIGKMVAIWVKEDSDDFADIMKPAVRIPIYGQKSKRRFVIHFGNFDSPSQARGVSKLAPFVYELAKMTDYDIAEIEAVVASALWMGIVETDKDAVKKSVPFKVAGADGTTATAKAPERKEGISQIDIGKKALVMQNLAPGQTFKGFQPNRPNPNFAAFQEVFEGRISSAVGMPLSILRLRFKSNYSASRAELLSFWHTIEKIRDDVVSGFLTPAYLAWFSESVRSGETEAPGFNRTSTKMAWVSGTWNGIARPHVDPLKEVKAVQVRQELGHTTGERESKAYNGSDFRDNAERLKIERELLPSAESTFIYNEQKEEEENEDN